MEIAIIGWGSLIWSPGELQLATRWHPDGPVLPIEFARISKDGRLTLVIHPSAEGVRTYWARSALSSIEAAREDLRRRENTGLSQIHLITVDNNAVAPEAEAAATIRSWLNTRSNLGAAVWTGLGCNWEAKRGRPFSVGDAIDYIANLQNERNEDGRFERAREYIEKAPTQIQTRLRAMLRNVYDPT